MSTHAARIAELRKTVLNFFGVDARTDQERAGTEFVHFAKYLMLAKGSLFGALELAEEKRALPRIKEVLKAAATAGTTTNSTWAAPLSAYTQIADGFLASLRNVGVFDAALLSMKNVPMKSQVTVTTLGATAASIGEGQVKVISKLALANSQMDPLKACAICVVADDLLKMSGNLGTNLLNAELSGAVAAETDAAFIREITSGVSSISSSGTTATAILSDIGNALGALSLNSQSKVFLAVDPGTAKLWALTLNANGSFPGLTINGGTLMGCTVVPTDALSSTLVAFDATQLAANGGTVELDASNQSSIQMDAQPDSPPSGSTPVVSFWENNLTGMRATRYFGAERLGSNAVSKVTGVANSPA
jgi:hypothetical protein